MPTLLALPRQLLRSLLSLMDLLASAQTTSLYWPLGVLSGTVTVTVWRAVLLWAILCVGRVASGASWDVPSLERKKLVFELPADARP